MINVGVREEHVRDRRCVKGQFGIALKRFSAAALVQAAIEENAMPAHINQVHRAGGSARGTIESYLHTGGDFTTGAQI
jgi:hypothetical protein